MLFDNVHAYFRITTAKWKSLHNQYVCCKNPVKAKVVMVWRRNQSGRFFV